jgi:hypothetical protein
MNISAFYRLMVVCFFMTGFPALLFAEIKDIDTKKSLRTYRMSIEISSVSDSIPLAAKPGEKKIDDKKQGIKEVPKSRRQLKPIAVAKGVKIKPVTVKVPKPKIRILH